MAHCGKRFAIPGVLVLLFAAACGGIIGTDGS